MYFKAICKDIWMLRLILDIWFDDMRPAPILVTIIATCGISI